MPVWAGMLCTCCCVHAVVNEVRTSWRTEIETYATISRPKAIRPLNLHAQRRLRIQFGIAPATNAPIEQAVVLNPITYRMGKTIALVPNATPEPIV